MDPFCVSISLPLYRFVFFYSHLKQFGLTFVCQHDFKYLRSQHNHKRNVIVIVAVAVAVEIVIARV